jgi:hypothetical protein
MTELVDIAGGKNVYADITAPSASVSLEDVARRDPDFILAGPQGVQKISEDRRWRIIRAVRQGRVLKVDTVLVGRPSDSVKRRYRSPTCCILGQSTDAISQRGSANARPMMRFRSWYWLGLVAALMVVAMIAVARGAVPV